MRIRDSGMPAAALWDSFFEPDGILDRLELDPGIGVVVEFGCGYGTFTLPAARRARGSVHALDIEAEAIDAARARVGAAGLTNVRFEVRDFVAHGSGLPAECADYAMLFNILHAEHPVALLAEARRGLAPGGRVGVIHWNPDPETPRGPPMSIRPRPEDCLRWAREAGLDDAGRGVVDLPPWHYGLVLEAKP